MPKGRSYATDQWDAFEKGQQTFVQDEFVHDKTFVFKSKLEKQVTVDGKEDTVSGVNIKQSFSEKTEGLSGVGEVKFWYNVWQKRSIFAKVGTNSNLIVQYDHGINESKGNICNNFYTSLQVNRSFTQKIGIFGVQFFKNKLWALNTRVAYDFVKKNISIDNKANYTNGRWRINGFTCVDITNKILSKTGILIGLLPAIDSKCKCSYFLRFENLKKNSSLSLAHIFENIAVNWNTQISDSQTVGVQAKLGLKNIHNLWKDHLGAFDSLWLASQWRLVDTVVKAKVSKDLSHAITVKNKLGSYGSYSLGVQASELGTKNRFKFGVQIDLNI